LIETVEMVKLL